MLPGRPFALVIRCQNGFRRPAGYIEGPLFITEPGKDDRPVKEGRHVFIPRERLYGDRLPELQTNPAFRTADLQLRETAGRPFSFRRLAVYYNGSSLCPSGNADLQGQSVPCAAHVQFHGKFPRISRYDRAYVIDPLHTGSAGFISVLPVGHLADH